MPLTHTKSAKRLRSSPNLSKLDPQGETNFWDFYRKNTAAVEDIFAAQAWILASYLSSDERDDLHQEVLLRLYRCNALSKFKPNLASFSTYLTGTIRGYIMNWLDVRNTKSIPLWRSSKGAEASRYERVYYKSLNGTNNEDDMSEDLPSSEHLEEGYSAREAVKLLRDNLPDKLKPLFNLMYVGLNKGEIARNFNLAPTAVSGMVSKVAAHGRKILERSRA